MAMSNTNQTSDEHSEPIDLDEVETTLAEVELMLERLDQRDA